MLKLLMKAFIAYMIPVRKPRGYRFKYGVNVTAVSADGKSISLTFTFRSGIRYCCMEPGCHHGLLLQSDYDRLREAMSEAGVEVGRPMRIRVRYVYEGGALFAVDPGASEPRYQPVGNTWETEVVYDEADALE